MFHKCFVTSKHDAPWTGTFLSSLKGVHWWLQLILENSSPGGHEKWYGLSLKNALIVKFLYLEMEI